MPVRIAVSQFAAGNDKAANLNHIEQAATLAAGQGAELLVLPEYSMFFDPDAEQLPHAEPLDGQFAGDLQDIAAHRWITIVAGMTETMAEGGKVYNTIVVVGADGKLVTRYRKVHLYDAFGFAESDVFAAGPIAEPVVFEVGDVRFGLQTCFDLRFPEGFRRLVDAGAIALLVPSAWFPGPLKEKHWTTLLAARAIENTSFVVGCGQAAPTCVGRSVVFDPQGVTVTAADASETLLYAEIDPAVVAEVRQRVPVLSNRRFRVG